MSVRAKFFVASKTECTYGDDLAWNINLYGVFTHQDGREGNATEENLIFGKWTPGACIGLTIVNPDAAAQFEQGKEYYVDFTSAESEAVAATTTPSYDPASDGDEETAP